MTKQRRSRTKQRDHIRPLPVTHAATIEDVIRNLVEPASALEGRGSFIKWPPDVFAVCASILIESGAYIKVVNQWPPCKDGRNCFRGHSRKAHHPFSTWQECIEALGDDWAVSASQHSAAPSSIANLWDKVWSQRSQSLPQVIRTPGLANSLLQLLAAADCACAGFGYQPAPESSAAELELWLMAQRLLIERNTLCRAIHRAKAAVLPKCRTPQNGITIRSLSHHLALLPRSGVDAQYNAVSWSPRAPQKRAFNLLVVPWPRKILPTQFRPVERQTLSAQGVDVTNMDEDFGFFSYDPQELTTSDFDLFNAMCEETKRAVGSVDIVVFPEMALLRDDFLRIRDIAFLHGANTTISGMPLYVNRVKTNCAVISHYDGSDFMYLRQPKHHRWMIERGQIEQYGLGSVLAVEKRWWEETGISERGLQIQMLGNWMATCVLVCEDLARPDPVGDVIRAVGPNLIIALLQDAAQMKGRWPAYAATVLAGDPGSSVLTVSSLGMVNLSSPSDSSPRNNSVALWKQPYSQAREIALPPGNEGVILCLACASEKEYTADGRDDHGVAAYPVLAGVHYVTGTRHRSGTKLPAHRSKK